MAGVEPSKSGLGYPVAILRTEDLVGIVRTQRSLCIIVQIKAD